MGMTDASGKIYFTTPLDLATEAFQEWLVDSGQFKWASLPIVHVSCDYFQPLERYDEVDVHVQLEEAKTRSFSLSIELRKEEIKIATCRFVHVYLDESGAASPLPSRFREWLETKLGR